MGGNNFFVQNQGGFNNTSHARGNISVANIGFNTAYCGVGLSKYLRQSFQLFVVFVFFVLLFAE